MKVILLKSHKDVGKKGEVVDVKKGFAVNFLIPRNIAEAATDEAVKKAELRKKQRKESRAAAKDKISHLADNISGKTFRITAETSSGGRIYGSISKQEVEKKLKKAWGIDSGDDVAIDLDLAKPLRQSGKYPIDVKVKAADREDTVEIILEVVGQ
jgi:large subunit ribosomal protein L9